VPDNRTASLYTRMLGLCRTRAASLGLCNHLGPHHTACHTHGRADSSCSVVARHQLRGVAVGRWPSGTAAGCAYAQLRCRRQPPRHDRVGDGAPCCAGIGPGSGPSPRNLVHHRSRCGQRPQAQPMNWPHTSRSGNARGVGSYASTHCRPRADRSYRAQGRRGDVGASGPRTAIVHRTARHGVLGGWRSSTAPWRNLSAANPLGCDRTAALRLWATDVV